MNPKDIVILIDNSESMSKTKQNLAYHTVISILDTLGTNDFVHVMKVGKNSEPIVDCFQGFVQVNLYIVLLKWIYMWKNMRVLFKFGFLIL